MVQPVDLEFEDDMNERDRQVLLAKIGKILEKIRQLLPNSAEVGSTEQVFTCKEPPQVSMRDYLGRFMVYG